MGETNIRLMEHVLVQRRKDQILVLDMQNDELFMLQGDVGELVCYLNERTAGGHNSNPEEIRNHLLKNSETFKINPQQAESIDKAIKYLSKIKIVKYVA